MIALDGVHLEPVSHGTKTDEFDQMSVFFNIESISYGVQDLVYTRVFSMIIVKDTADVKGNAARRLTYALAAAFQDYSRRVKALQASSEYEEPAPTKPRFAIDLRTPEEIEADLETEA
ncbi:hypothetical protein HF086_006757 [Spodoptera exigua]|uniref:Uncharacterized protein n=1 Tax=Spodoptera exigua TaxID=7107 RepID=A0A922M323_SPOEX|nr:hypothetical protein HF086_006757 [Spodoptera exigua]